MFISASKLILQDEIVCGMQTIEYTQRLPINRGPPGTVGSLRHFDAGRVCIPVALYWDADSSNMHTKKRARKRHLSQRDAPLWGPSRPVAGRGWGRAPRCRLRRGWIRRSWRGAGWRVAPATAIFQQLDKRYRGAAVAFDANARQKLRRCPPTKINPNAPRSDYQSIH